MRGAAAGRHLCRRRSDIPRQQVSRCPFPPFPHFLHKTLDFLKMELDPHQINSWLGIQTSSSLAMHCNGSPSSPSPSAKPPLPCVTNRLLAGGSAARWADGDGTATPQVPGTVGFLDSSPHHHCWALISFSTSLLTRQIWARKTQRKSQPWKISLRV